MGWVSITFKLMPESPSVDMDKLKTAVEAKCKEMSARFKNSTEDPIAFGLKALMCIIEWPEDSDPDLLEAQLAKLQDVRSIQITDVRRKIA